MSDLSSPKALGLGHLSLTTALALILTATIANADTLYWDVGARDDGVIEGGSGEWWRNFNQSWTDAEGDENVAFQNGDTVVFGQSATAESTVSVRNAVNPVQVIMNGNGYTFTGSRIGETNSNTGFQLQGGSSTTFKNELRGRLSFGGAGSFVLEGQSLNIQTVSVADGTRLLTREGAVTSGNLQADGRLQIGGEHRGDVTIAAGGVLSLIATGRIRGDLTNGGTTNMTGRVDETVTNQATGTLVIFDGAQAGDIDNQGTVDLRGDLTVDRDFFNAEDGIVTVGAGRDVTVDVDDDFINEGVVALDPTASLAISASDILLAETSQISGDIDLRGRVENRGQLTFTSASELTARLTNRDTGQVGFSADMDVNGHGILNQGTMQIGAGVILSDAGTVINEDTLTMAAGAVIGGDLASTGTSNLTGRITGSVAATDGALNITGPLSVGDNLRTDGAAMAINGDLAVGGLLGTDGDVTGTGNVSADRMENGGDFTLTGPAGLTVAGEFENNTGATLDVTGAVTGNLVNAGEATVGSLAGTIRNVQNAVLSVAGTLTGTLDNAGEALVSGGVTGSVLNRAELTLGGDVTSDLLNSGIVNVTGATTVGGLLQSTGRLNVTGTLTSAQLELGNNAVLDAVGAVATNILNEGTVRLGQGLAGSLVNNGQVAIGEGAAVSGAVDNRDVLVAEGDLVIAGGFVNTGTLGVTNGPSVRTISVAGGMQNNGTVNLGNGSVGDRLAIDGGLSGNGEYIIGFSPSTGLSDQIVITNGATTGTITLRFSLPTGQGFDVLGNPLLLIDADDTFAEANDYQVLWTGLPDPSESFVYSLDKQPSGDLFMVGQVNPGIGALSGNVILTESLIGTVINRPSSPFVVGRAYQDEKACAPGGWARAIGGKATAQGGTTNGESRLNSEIDASFHGIQFGGDMACFDGAFRGWDVAAGVIGGVNRGSTTQPVFAVDPNNSQELTDIRTSTTDGDFEQVFGGLYLTATRGRFTSDLQVRMSKTEYELNNTPAAQGYTGLGLTETTFDAKGRTISGSASYAFPLAADGVSIVPTLGFAWNDVDVDTIRFDNGSTLEIQGADSRIGFAGATLSWTTVADSGIAALNRFVTVTHYNDFADDIISVYSMQEQDGTIDSETLTSDNLGAYSELSVGMNYVRVLDNGGWGPGRQFNASVRVDGRSGASLDSWGLTGQVRWQF